MNKQNMNESNANKQNINKQNINRQSINRQSINRQNISRQNMDEQIGSNKKEHAEERNKTDLKDGSNVPVWINRKNHVNAQDRIAVHEKDGVTFLTFPILDRIEGITHGFSTRLGGVSEGDVGTMNLSFGREQNRENVRENHRRLAAAVGYNPERMVFSRQTHTTNVMVVRREDRGKGYTKHQEFDDIDGLVTDVPGIPLVTFYADCVPLLIVDPVHHAIGCSHSGWRGTVGNMGKSTLEVMKREYGTDPAEAYAAIGPSICQDCYEVSEDVIEQFRNAYPEKMWSVLFCEKENGKYQLNLWEACRQNFLSAGMMPDHVSLPDICTCCNPGFLFSHRASHGKRGNMAAVLMLNGQ